MVEGDDFMAHINKIKGLANQLTIVDNLIDEYDIVMTLLVCLLKSYNYLIVALRSIKKLTLYYIIVRLVNEVTNK